MYNIYIYIYTQFWDIGWGEKVDAYNSRRAGPSTTIVQPPHARHESVSFSSFFPLPIERVSLKGDIGKEGENGEEDSYNDNNNKFLDHFYLKKWYYCTNIYFSFYIFFIFIWMNKVIWFSFPSGIIMLLKGSNN